MFFERLAGTPGVKWCTCDIYITYIRSRAPFPGTPSPSNSIMAYRYKPYQKTRPILIALPAARHPLCPDCPPPVENRMIYNIYHQNAESAAKTSRNHHFERHKNIVLLRSGYLNISIHRPSPFPAKILTSGTSTSPPGGAR